MRLRTAARWVVLTLALLGSTLWPIGWSAWYLLNVLERSKAPFVFWGVLPEVSLLAFVAYLVVVETGQCMERDRPDQYVRIKSGLAPNHTGSFDGVHWVTEMVTRTETYDADLYGWAMRQATLLRQGRLSEIEVDHLAEQLEELGMSEYDKLESILRILLLHMLKWDNQPDRRSRSWALTILEQRRRLDRQITKNPSLKARIAEAIDGAWGDARLAAARETDLPLSAFPEPLAYQWQDMVQREFPWDR